MHYKSVVLYADGTKVTEEWLNDEEVPGSYKEEEEGEWGV